MGILTWIKLGSLGAIVIATGIFYWSYQHRGRVIEAQKIQIEQLEAAQKYYEAQPKIDEHTKEMQREVKKATEQGDVDRVRWLYDQLRKHRTGSQGQAPGKAGDGGLDE